MGDSERLVQVSPFGEVGRDESASWHLAHSSKKARIVHTLGDDRLDKIFVSAHRIIMHLLSDYSPAGGQCSEGRRGSTDKRLTNRSNPFPCSGRRNGGIVGRRGMS